MGVDIIVGKRGGFEHNKLALQFDSQRKSIISFCIFKLPFIDLLWELDVLLD